METYLRHTRTGSSETRFIGAVTSRLVYPTLDPCRLTVVSDVERETMTSGENERGLEEGTASQR